MKSFLEAFLFFLPGGLANMAPVLANRIPGWNKWNTTLDFGKTLRGKRIFGEHKTFRGIVSGVIFAALVAAALTPFTHNIVPDYRVWPPLLGGLMGAGALIGDAVESFFKRQIGVGPGRSWFPFDQTDYIIGGLLFALPFTGWQPALMARVLTIYFGLHLLTSFIGFKVGLKDSPI